MGALPAAVTRPAYDRKALKTGIVHLGIGAFMRAHLAPATEAVLAAGDLRWGIVGVSLRQPDTRDALQPQDGLYTLAIRDADAQGHARVLMIHMPVSPTKSGAVFSHTGRTGLEWVVCPEATGQNAKSKLEVGDAVPSHASNGVFQLPGRNKRCAVGQQRVTCGDFLTIAETPYGASYKMGEPTR